MGDHAARIDVCQTDLNVAQEIDLIEQALIALDIYYDRDISPFLPQCYWASGLSDLLQDSGRVATELGGRLAPYLRITDDAHYLLLSVSSHDIAAGLICPTRRLPVADWVAARDSGPSEDPIASKKKPDSS